MWGSNIGRYWHEFNSNLLIFSNVNDLIPLNHLVDRNHIISFLHTFASSQVCGLSFFYTISEWSEHESNPIKLSC